MIEVVAYPPENKQICSKDVDAKIMEILSRCASPHAHVVKTSVRWSQLRYPRTEPIEYYASQLGVPLENDFFASAYKESTARMHSTKLFGRLYDIAELFVNERALMTAICICPDGWVCFGRSLIENN